MTSLDEHTGGAASLAARNRNLGWGILAAVGAMLLLSYATRHVLFHVVFQ